MTKNKSESLNNVLFITVDSLRHDWTLTGDVELPGIAKLSEDGVSFNQAYATGPGTTPSFPAMLTGTLPLSYGGLGPLTDERPRVARNLQNSGFTTGGFQSNPFLSRHFNYHEGFDTFQDYQNPLMGIATKIFPRGIELTNPRIQKLDEIFHITDIIKKSYEFIKGKPRPYVDAETITDDAIDWLSTVEQPFFGWVHYMDVHHPCYPPRKYRAQFDVADVTQSEVSEWYSQLLTEPDSLSEAEISALRRLYDAAVVYTDVQVSRLIDNLCDLGKYENTLVVFTSDHGELFGEHGRYGKPERMYDELLRVPLIVANGPDSLSEATENLVSLLDLPPLFHEAVGLPVPDAYEGRNMDKNPRSYVLGEHEVNGEVVVGARGSDWLYEVDEIRDENRLYDARNEQFQQVDPADHPEIKRIREPVLNRLSELDVNAHHLDDEVEGDVQDRLEDLGYL